MDPLIVPLEKSVNMWNDKTAYCKINYTMIHIALRVSVCVMHFYFQRRLSYEVNFPFLLPHTVL
jgi:hypothetical protein